MNLAQLYRKLITAARSTPPDERVPYAFEKRIMARLEGKLAPDSWSLWGRAFYRAAIYSVVLMVVVSASSFFIPANNPVTLAQDVDQTLFAAVDSNAD